MKLSYNSYTVEKTAGTNMKQTTCKRCKRQLKRAHKSGMGLTCEKKSQTEVTADDLTFAPQRYGAQYGRR